MIQCYFFSIILIKIKEEGEIYAPVTSKEILIDAQKNRYAIGAFNANNMEIVQAIIDC